jgi:hypothetical protein
MEGASETFFWCMHPPKKLVSQDVFFKEQELLSENIEYS